MARKAQTAAEIAAEDERDRKALEAVRNQPDAQVKVSDINFYWPDEGRTSD